MSKKSIFLTSKSSRKKLKPFTLIDKGISVDKKVVRFFDINEIKNDKLINLIKSSEKASLTFSTNKIDGKYFNQNILRIEGDCDLDLLPYEDADIMAFISSIYNNEDRLNQLYDNKMTNVYDEIDVIAPDKMIENDSYIEIDDHYIRAYTIINPIINLDDIEQFMDSNIKKTYTIFFEKVKTDDLKANLEKYYSREINKLEKYGARSEILNQIEQIENKRDKFLKELDKNKGAIYTKSAILTIKSDSITDLEKDEDIVRKYLLNEGSIIRPLYTNNLLALNSQALGVSYINNKAVFSFDNDIDFNLRKFLSMSEFKKSFYKTNNRLSTQDTLFLDDFIKDGILHLGNGKYSKSFKIKSINFETLDEEDQEQIILRYQEFLNSFTKEVEVYVTINNKKIYIDEFTKEILLKDKNDNKDYMRKEYNDMLLDKISKGINSIQRERYVTLSLEADSYKEAIEKFNIYTDLMKRSIKTIGSGDKNNSDLEVLSEEDRIEVLFNLLNPEKGKYLKYYNIEKMRKEGLTISDIIAPDFMNITSNYIKINDYYVSFYFISELPNLLNPSFFAGINEEFNEQILTTVTYNPYEQKEAVKLISSQYLNYNAELESLNKRSKLNNSLFIIPPKLEVALEETKALLDDVTVRDQKLFKTNVVVGVYGKTKVEMDKNASLLKDYCDRKMVSLTIAKNMQEYALNSCLPIGQDMLPMKRSLTSEAGAVYMPFKTQNILDPSGMYYGVNPANKDLILVNRKKFKNGNGFILGKPGGGKSFAAKNEILNTILTTDDDVIIVDPENEYRDLCLSLDGEYIPIEQSSPYHMNLFDIEENDKEDGGLEGSIKEKVSFITGCVGLMMERVLTIEESAILDDCITQIYKSWFKYVSEQERNKQEVNYEYFPTLTTLRDKLGSLQGREKNEAYSLITALRMYTTGSLNMFDQQSNINPRNRLAVFSIRGLNNEGVLKKLAMNIIMDQLWQRLLRNGKNGRPTWIYIDEIYLLFDNVNSMNFLRNLWKRARKYNGFPTGITQNVDDLLAIHDARTMLSNADFVMMLTQSSIDKSGLATLYNLGETLQTYITDSEPGHGLIHTEFGTIPFENKFPKNTHMYEVMTTNPAEKAEIQRRKQNEIERANKIKEASK